MSKLSTPYEVKFYSRRLELVGQILSGLVHGADIITVEDFDDGESHYDFAYCEEMVSASIGLADAVLRALDPEDEVGEV